MKFVLFYIFFVSLSSKASLDFNSSVNAGGGGGGRAAIEAYGAALSNPAILSKLSNQQFSSSFIEDQMVLSFTDSSPTNLFAGGLTFKENRSWDLLDKDRKPGESSAEESRQPGQKRPSLQRFSVSVSDRFAERFGFGLNINMWNYRDGLSDRKERESSYNFDVGFIWAPLAKNNDLSVATIFSNIANQGEKIVSEKSAIAASYVFNQFVRFRYDLESAEKFDFETPSHMLGFESYLNDWIVWRLGYKTGAELKASEERVARKDSNLWTAGLGFAGPKLGLHYAFIQETQFAKESRHSIDLGYSF